LKLILRYYFNVSLEELSKGTPTDLTRNSLSLAYPMRVSYFTALLTCFPGSSF